MSRFKNRDRFASCNGTGPIEVSSGGRTHDLGPASVRHAVVLTAP